MKKIRSDDLGGIHMNTDIPRESNDLLVQPADT